MQTPVHDPHSIKMLDERDDVTFCITTCRSAPPEPFELQVCSGIAMASRCTTHTSQHTRYVPGSENRLRKRCRRKKIQTPQTGEVGVHDACSCYCCADMSSGSRNAAEIAKPSQLQNNPHTTHPLRLVSSRP